MTRVRGLWGREPAAVLAVVQAGLALGIGFGVTLTQEQMALILALTAAVIGLITRQHVAPMERMRSGERPDGHRDAATRGGSTHHESEMFIIFLAALIQTAQTFMVASWIFTGEPLFLLFAMFGG